MGYYDETNLHFEHKPHRVTKKSKTKSVMKNVASTVAAGVIGSVLTLTIAPHTDYFQGLVNERADSTAVQQGTTKGPTNVVATQTSTKNSGSIADIVEQSSKAIVGIVNYQKQGGFFSQDNNQSVETGSGSGIIFKKDSKYAYIVTNNHVTEGATKIEVSLYGGKKTTAKLIGADALSDLAVLKVDSKYVTDVINFGDSSKLRPGEQVLAIGNPLGLDLSRTVTEGIVSAVDRTISVDTSAGKWDLNVIQTDAAINPGNSGGALINTQGQVVGINSLKISESGVEGLGFAIPSNELLPIVNEIILKGKVERPYVGVGLASLEEIPQMYLQNLPKEVDGGAFITNIDPNSSAAKAGLQVQDIILSINGTKVKNPDEFRKYLYTKVHVGDEIKLKLCRYGKMVDLKVTLSSKNTPS